MSPRRLIRTLDARIVVGEVYQETGSDPGEDGPDDPVRSLQPLPPGVNGGRREDRRGKEIVDGNESRVIPDAIVCVPGILEENELDRYTLQTQRGARIPV